MSPEATGRLSQASAGSAVFFGFAECAAAVVVLAVGLDAAVCSAVLLADDESAAHPVTPNTVAAAATAIPCFNAVPLTGAVRALLLPIELLRVGKKQGVGLTGVALSPCRYKNSPI
jgi:hypothetical protein